MTTNNTEPYSIKVIKFTLKTIWNIIGVLTNIVWYTFSKLPKPITLGLLPLTVICASGIVTPVVSNEKAIIIYDIPTPTEQRLIDLEGTTWEYEDILWYVNLMATKYNVNEDTMKHIIQGESQFNPSTRDGDMHITCERTGLPVRARGLVQITECYFPDISDQEARDPEYSIKFLAENMSQGLGVMLWSTHPDRV